MPPDYVIFACFCLVFYFYIHQNNQFMSTASAIRSVFSGECRMSCRQSQASGLSGLSGLQSPGPSQEQARNSLNCVCETCPCALVENVLRTCSPATRMYTLITAMLSQIYINFIESINDAYFYASNVVECGTSCQKPQIVEASRHDSLENFSFKEPKTLEAMEVATSNAPVSLSSSKEGPSRTSLTSSKKSSSVFLKELILRKKKSNEDKQSGTDAVMEVPSQSTSTGVGSGACPKCVEEGQICKPDCPNTKK